MAERDPRYFKVYQDGDDRNLEKQVIDIINSGAAPGIDTQARAEIEEIQRAIENGEIGGGSGVDQKAREDIQQVTAQLADTAKKSEIEAVDSRVSNIIATAGDGTIPTELADMRTGKDGTRFDTAGDYVRHLEEVMGIETTTEGGTTETSVYDLYNVPHDAGVSAGTPYRVWGIRLKPMTGTTNKIKIKLAVNNIIEGAKLHVEFRASLNGDLLGSGIGDLSPAQDYCTITLDRSVSLSNGVYITSFQVKDGAVVRIPFVRTSTKDTNIDTSSDVGVYFNTSDVIGEPAKTAGATHNGFVFQLFMVTQGQVKKVITNVKTSASVTPIAKTYTVGKSGAMFTKIQDAVNQAVDGDTILIHPGEYKEAVDSFSKKLNIVGTSKENCILYNDTSDYYTPPLEIAAGMVKGLTIIETHANPDPAKANESTYEWERAYTIHIDNIKSTGNKLIVDDCIIRNNKRWAFGIGLFQDFELIISNCIIWGGEATRENLDGGGVYFHNRLADNNVTNQKIRLINNVVHSDDIFALSIQDVTKTGFVSDLECEFINNMFYSKINGKNCVKGKFTTNIRLAPSSYGNNIAMLNA